MTKLKINPAVASLLVIASVFAGWQTALIITMLVLIFIDIEDSTKKIIVRTIGFLLTITLLSYGWDLIVSLWEYLQTIIASFVSFLNSYLNYNAQISLIKLDEYFFLPVGYLLTIVTEGIDIVVFAAKIFFVASIIFGKKVGSNPISNKITKTIDKIVTYVNNYGSTPAPAAPVAPSAPAAPQPPVPPVTPTA